MCLLAFVYTSAIPPIRPGLTFPTVATLAAQEKCSASRPLRILIKGWWLQRLTGVTKPQGKPIDFLCCLKQLLSWKPSWQTGAQRYPTFQVNFGVDVILKSIRVKSRAPHLLSVSTAVVTCSSPIFKGAFQVQGVCKKECCTLSCTFTTYIHICTYIYIYIFQLCLLFNYFLSLAQNESSPTSHRWQHGSFRISDQRLEGKRRKPWQFTTKLDTTWRN